MKVSIKLDTKTADLFNLLRGDRSIGAFGLECIKLQLTALNRSVDSGDKEESNTIRLDKAYHV